MAETLPKFNKEENEKIPEKEELKPKPEEKVWAEVKKEIDELGKEKISQERRDEIWGQVKKEIDKSEKKHVVKEEKDFDKMTQEEREEWEYNRDKERGFKVIDRMSDLRKLGGLDKTVVDMDEFKAKKEKEESEQKEVEKIRENIKNSEAPKTETTPRPEAPKSAKQEIFKWFNELRKYDLEMEEIEKDYNDAKNRPLAILGLDFIYKKLDAFRNKFNKFAEKELIKLDQSEREIAIDELAKLTQRIEDIEDQIVLNGGKLEEKKRISVFKPFRKIKEIASKPIRRFRGILRRNK